MRRMKASRAAPDGSAPRPEPETVTRPEALVKTIRGLRQRDGGPDASSGFGYVRAASRALTPGRPRPPCRPESALSPTSSLKTGAELRRAFLDFFVQRGHVEVPSSPLVPH